MEVLTQRKLERIPLKIQDHDTSSEDASIIKKKSAKRLRKVVGKARVERDVMQFEKIKKVSGLKAS